MPVIIHVNKCVFYNTIVSLYTVPCNMGVIYVHYIYHYAVKYIQENYYLHPYINF